MKLYFFCFLLAIVLVSCENEEQPKENLPEWLEQKIQEIQALEDHCFSCEITRYTYNDRYYYNYYCGYWSCMFCNLYNDQGVLINEEDNFNFEDFLSSYKEEKVVWSCRD